jgi:hypothetical protein
MAPTGNVTSDMPQSEEIPSSISADDGKQYATKTSPLNGDFEKLVRETLDKWHIQGIAVAVVDGDETWAEVPLLCHVLVAPFTKKLTGIWNRSLARCPRSSFYLVLHWQYDQILHCCGGLVISRRRKIPKYQMDHPP